MSRILQGSLKFLLTNALPKSIDKPFQLEYISFTQHLSALHTLQIYNLFWTAKKYASL
jgi:hypothetical protein